LVWAAGAQAQGQAAIAVAMVDNSGAVTNIEIEFGGVGYVSPPMVSLIGGGGTGAAATAQVFAGAVNNIIINHPGSGYTNAPVVAIDPPPVPINQATLGLFMVPELVITGQTWQVQQVQYVDALGDTGHWVTLTNIVMGNSPCYFFDTSAVGMGSRFYRVLTLGAPGPDPTRWAWINPGTYIQGSPDTEYDRSADESPQTQVTFTNGFWIGRFTVTEGEFAAIMGTNFNFLFPSDTNQPMDEITWFDATNYCALLTQQEQVAGRVPAGYVYRLPTEADWEYAVRAGTTMRFPFGDDHTYTLLPNYAWFSTNSLGTTHDVGGKFPNPWGLYDTSGNVFEWCADFYGPYSGGSVTNPVGPATGLDVVMRGGSAYFPGGDCRSAARDYNPPNFSSHGIGFRVVLGPPLH